MSSGDNAWGMVGEEDANRIGSAFPMMHGAGMSCLGVLACNTFMLVDMRHATANETLTCCDRQLTFQAAQPSKASDQMTKWAPYNRAEITRSEINLSFTDDRSTSVGGG